MTLTPELEAMFERLLYADGAALWFSPGGMSCALNELCELLGESPLALLDVLAAYQTTCPDLTLSVYASRPTLLANFQALVDADCAEADTTLN